MFSSSINSIINIILCKSFHRSPPNFAFWPQTFYRHRFTGMKMFKIFDLNTYLKLLKLRLVLQCVYFPFFVILEIEILLIYNYFTDTSYQIFLLFYLFYFLLIFDFFYHFSNPPHYISLSNILCYHSNQFLMTY